jgi:hypothetical protein
MRTVTLALRAEADVGGCSVGARGFHRHEGPGDRGWNRETGLRLDNLRGDPCGWTTSVVIPGPGSPLAISQIWTKPT